MMTPANIASWWLQSGTIIAAALLLPRLLRMRHYRSELLLLQLVLLACLALPLVQPWRREAPEAGVGPVRRLTPSAPQPQAPPVEWTRWVLPLVAAGAAVRLLWLAVGLWRLKRYRHAGRPMADAGIRAQVLICDALNGPATFGWLRPVVLLPPRALEMSPAALRSVLLHEMLHIERADWPAALAEETVAALLWFQPAVWWLLARIRLLREHAVDSAVVARTGEREPYVHALLSMAAGPLDPDLNPAPPMLRRRNRLPVRVHSLLHEVTVSKARLCLSHAFMATALAAVGIAMSAQYPLQAAPPQHNPDLEPVFKAPVPYPATAKARRIEGVVSVEIHVNEDGEVVDGRVTSGPQELRKAALQSVLLWRYNNKAKAPLTTVVDVNFTLADAAAAPPAAPASFDPPAPGVQRIRVGGNVQAQKLVHKVPPVYPPLARQARLQGTVRHTVLIDADGAAKSLQLVSGHPLLVESAQQAVTQWRWSNTLLNGVPVEVVTMVDVNYTLLP